MFISLNGTHSAPPLGCFVGTVGISQNTTVLSVISGLGVVISVVVSSKLVSYGRVWRDSSVGSIFSWSYDLSNSAKSSSVDDGGTIIVSSWGRSDSAVRSIVKMTVASIFSIRRCCLPYTFTLVSSTCGALSFEFVKRFGTL